MGRSAADTKRKLLVAAAEEFSAHGVAGARTGRIARAAQVNEALLFRYFGNKEALFETVYNALVVEAVDEVPLDAHQLPGYAAALFDYYRQHGQVLRLSVWAALERPQAAAATAVVTAATAKKVSSIEAAQQAGVIATRLQASELLSLVIQLSMSGTEVAPALGISADSDTRRASIVTAVSALIDH